MEGKDVFRNMSLWDIKIRSEWFVWIVVAKQDNSMKQKQKQSKHGTDEKEKTMTVKERASCINTIKLLQRLAFNVHGVMDVIDAENCDKIIKMLEADAQQWITCSNCARNADNGGLYPDGRTRCPIQEHYALLKDGYCHLAEPWKGEDNGQNT